MNLFIHVCLTLILLSIISRTEENHVKSDMLVVNNEDKHEEHAVKSTSTNTKDKHEEHAVKSTSTNTEDKNEELTDEIFYPSKEWQAIKPGQAIPQGLHVRINLQTGTKEAKLMDGDDGVKYWKEGQRLGVVNTKHKYFTHQELKDALKSLKSDESPKTEIDITKNMQKKFRSIEQLKSEFSKLKINFHTDAEIIEKLIKEFQTNDISVEEKENILQDLEYYLHQYDNAQNFVKMGGLSMLIQGLNDTHENIRRESAFVLGSAMQSNPRVQIAAIESGALQQLLRMLALEENVLTQSRTLYALSCLIRNFPVAQERFIQLGGFSTLGKIFHQPQANKLLVKIITLLNDLITEQHFISKQLQSDDTNQEKVRQYNRVFLEEAILEHGWCHLVPHLLTVQDHDIREKVLQAMLSLENICHSDFIQELSKLINLQEEYRQLLAYEKQNDSDSNDDFLSSVYSLIENLVSKLHLVKDEL